jgi:chromosome segregation ATPase
MTTEAENGVNEKLKDFKNTVVLLALHARAIAKQNEELRLDLHQAGVRIQAMEEMVKEKEQEAADLEDALVAYRVENKDLLEELNMAKRDKQQVEQKVEVLEAQLSVQEEVAERPLSSGDGQTLVFNEKCVVNVGQVPNAFTETESSGGSANASSQTAAITVKNQTT